MKGNVLYQISTHWDREWYLQFQGFRYYLVKMFSKLIEDIEKGRLSYFGFDGQTIVLEDYLEICPQDKERIEKLIANGQLDVGPWYVMPDELLVSGESLIHNMMVGKSVAEKFGTKPQRIGYVNDVFGHIAQMPQLFNGFGIDSVYLGRGLSSADRKYNNFLWYAPDGSRCFSYKYIYADYKRGFVASEDKETFFAKGLVPMDDKVPVVVINYTDDHAFTDENTELFQKMILETKDVNVVKGIDKLSEYLKPYEDILPVEKGELITTAEKSDGFAAVTGSISSYFTLKKENDECENLIYNTLAPIMVISEFSGVDICKNYYDLACKYLLKNQPHDSICGCSIDKVHKDMIYRYSQSKAIVDIITSEFNHHISVYDGNNDELEFALFNFDIHQKEKDVIIEIDFPVDWKSEYLTKIYYKKINMFSIIDELGRDVEYQIVRIERDIPRYYMQEERRVDVYKIAFKADLKAFGSTHYKIVPCERPAIYPNKVSDMCLFAENDYMVLEIKHNGSVNVTDKKTGKIYKNLNTFTDDGDCGNGWFHTKTDYGESVITSIGNPCTIEIVNQGPVLTQYRITKFMDVPKTTNYEDYRRSNDKDTLKIVTLITLYNDSDKLLFDTTVYNNIKNHRLRVNFPTKIEGYTYKSSQAFCFVERERGVTERGIVSFEPESYEKNTGGIISVSSNDASFSVICGNGIHEAGVSVDGTIAVTLFRSVGRMFHEINPTNCQIQGELKFSYAITFEKNNALLIEMQKDIRIPTYCVSANKLGFKLDSLIKTDNKDIVLSIVKLSSDGDDIVLRVYNPDNKVVSGSIVFGFKVKNVYESMLSEETKNKYKISDGTINVELNPYEIKTLRVEK